MFDYFYHSTIRKYVVCFGTLFNNIYVAKPQEDGSTKKYRVPLAYAAKEKYIRRIQEFETLMVGENDPRDVTYLPRMSFELKNMMFDSSRKRNTLYKNRILESTSDKMSYTYSEIPYNLEFNLHILTRKMDEGLQIIEQILPYFSPEFTVTVDLGSFARKIDIPITLSAYNQSIEFEGEADEGTDYRVISWELNFLMRGYLYGPVKNADIIKTSIARFFEYNDSGITGQYEAIRVGLTGGTGVSGNTYSPLSYNTNLEIFGQGSTYDIFGS